MAPVANRVKQSLGSDVCDTNAANIREYVTHSSIPPVISIGRRILGENNCNTFPIALVPG